MTMSKNHLVQGNSFYVINNLLTRMKKYHHQPVEQLSFDELTLNNLSKVVTVNGHEVPMRIKEFELLWYFSF